MCRIDGTGLRQLTDGGAKKRSPRWSPDGQRISFYSDRSGRYNIWSVHPDGGHVERLTDTATALVYPVWSPDGLRMADGTTLAFVAQQGGQPRLFVRKLDQLQAAALAGTEGAFGPFFSPDGQRIAFFGGGKLKKVSVTGFDAANLVVAPVAGGTPKVVVHGGYSGRYVPSGRGLPTRAQREGGHLVYLQQGTLFAVRFDLDRLETIGQAVPALEGLSASPQTGGAQLAVSSEGTLVYVPTAVTTVNSIDWVMRDGKTSVLRATKADWGEPRFSPDGQKLAVDIFDGKQRDIWVYDWARDTMTQLTFDPAEDRVPIWTPDSRRIVFSSDRAKPGVLNLYWVNADGTGDVTRLTNSPETQIAASWHPSGKFLAFQALRGATKGDLMILPMEGDAARGWTPGKPTVFLSTPANELFPQFSPDGRWIAYFSDEASATLDVYVRPFPGPGGTWRVSTEGGVLPRWSTTAHELLFLNPTQSKVMVAPYAVIGDSFRADRPQIWSPTSLAPRVNYDLHPDGKRLATVAAQNQGIVVQDKVVFVFNFFDYLQKIAPGAK